MFNLMNYWDSNSDKLSEEKETEVRDIIKEHNRQLCLKGYADYVRKENREHEKEGGS